MFENKIPLRQLLGQRINLQLTKLSTGYPFKDCDKGSRHYAYLFASTSRPKQLQHNMQQVEY